MLNVNWYRLLTIPICITIVVTTFYVDKIQPYNESENLYFKFLSILILCGVGMKVNKFKSEP
jgi:uncharacterized membrane protein